MGKEITVIVPVYNGASHLRETLHSVQMQQVIGLEILCVDDGSCDETPSILAEIAKKDSRMKVLRQENAGAGIARNTGIEAASGEYVAFMDADDLYPDDKVLSDMLHAARENHADICGGEFSHIYKGGVTGVEDADRAGYLFPKDGWVNYQSYQFDFGYTRFLYRRKLLIDGNIRFPGYCRFQDPPFFVQAMAAAGSFYALHRITYQYRVGHKTIKWGKRQMLDLMRGLRDNLVFSKEQQLAQLHRYTCQRMECNYEPQLTQAALSGDAELSAMLHTLNACVDISLLTADAAQAPFLLTALRKQVQSGAYSVFTATGLASPPEGQSVQVDVCELNAIRRSYSYRLGRGITFLPRHVGKVINSLRRHGVHYVFSRLRYAITHQADS